MIRGRSRCRARSAARRRTGSRSSGNAPAQAAVAGVSRLIRGGVDPPRPARHHAVADDEGDDADHGDDRVFASPPPGSPNTAAVTISRARAMTVETASSRLGSKRFKTSPSHRSRGPARSAPAGPCSDRAPGPSRRTCHAARRPSGSTSCRDARPPPACHSPSESGQGVVGPVLVLVGARRVDDAGDVARPGQGEGHVGAAEGLRRAIDRVHRRDVVLAAGLEIERDLHLRQVDRHAADARTRPCDSRFWPYMERR